ncbi:hypothetical protein [Glaciimonas sp. PAMC28666]|uniref:hypothetical protein n=1 Tax=Glaciimonas sp. PAMC28666 TaxID=2807626 RepID=UPI0019647A6D|nr:hypothetical protein [Glaciimonas sp. PAMC28666]QRX80893.1 hypothetical protein JQN73_11710 [Glaciimonas sp. PAMC28666]
MSKKINPEQLSDDNPEWSAEDFAKARPAKDVLPELFGKKIAVEMLKRPSWARP